MEQYEKRVWKLTLTGDANQVTVSFASPGYQLEMKLSTPLFKEIICTPEGRALINAVLDFIGRKC